MASTIQQTKFIMDNDRIEDDISDDEIYEAIQNSLKELKVNIFFISLKMSNCNGELLRFFLLYFSTLHGPVIHNNQ